MSSQQFEIILDGIETIVTSQLPGSIELKFTIPSKYSKLEGHFPNLPITPGVAQLHFVCTAISQWKNKMFNFNSFKRLKFQSLLLPNTEISLLIKETKPYTFSFKITQGSTNVASGNITTK